MKTKVKLNCNTCQTSLVLDVPFSGGWSGVCSECGESLQVLKVLEMEQVVNEQ